MKSDWGCPTFDRAAADFSRTLTQSDSRFTPGEAEFWLNTLINAYKADVEMKA